jgi:heat shock protein HslJ
VPEELQTSYTATFNDDGTFAARADCNQLTGSWTATAAGDLTITLGPSTIVACPDDSYSDLYVLAVSSVRSYAVADGQLTLTLKDQGTLGYGPAAASN